jgi:hypothetical protein
MEETNKSVPSASGATSFHFGLTSSCIETRCSIIIRPL